MDNGQSSPLPLSKKYEHLPPSWFEFLVNSELLTKHLGKLKENPNGESPNFLF